jgi:hypothetical protein
VKNKNPSPITIKFSSSMIPEIYSDLDALVSNVPNLEIDLSKINTPLSMSVGFTENYPASIETYSDYSIPKITIYYSFEIAFTAKSSYSIKLPKTRLTNFLFTNPTQKNDYPKTIKNCYTKNSITDTDRH